MSEHEDAYHDERTGLWVASFNGEEVASAETSHEVIRYLRRHEIRGAVVEYRAAIRTASAEHHAREGGGDA